MKAALADQPTHTVLAPPDPAAHPLPGGARVRLCLLRCGSGSGRDDLADLAHGRYRDDEFFLEHVSQTFSKYFIVMQVDGAGWHHSDELVIPSNIRLIQQPAYSPEVNPVEHVWYDVRKNILGIGLSPPLTP